MHLRDHLRGRFADRVNIGALASLRTRPRCPVCGFILEGMKEHASFRYADESADCFVDFKSPSVFSPLFKTSAGEEWRMYSLDEEILVLDMDNSQNPQLGRRIEINAGVCTQATGWLDHCESLHAETCPVPLRLIHSNDRPQALRVVDVVDNRLVNISWDVRYAALSYVWGTSEPPKLYSAQLQQLSGIGSLELLRMRMPQTIQDAMLLADNLRLRYLWFDSLCLVQDDPSDLNRGIMNMDAVYEGAVVTIIAAQGTSADSGLPGVSKFPKTPKQNFVIVKPGFQLLRFHSLDEELNKAIYASRGWTSVLHLPERLI